MTKVTEEEVIEIWTKKLHACNRINKEKAVPGIEFLYKLVDQGMPEIHYVRSPMELQAKVNELKGTTKQFYEVSTIGTITSYGWAAFYDYFKRNNELESVYNFEKYLELIDANFFNAYYEEKWCVVSEMPKEICLNGDRLHAEGKPALEWSDGFKMYFWNRINMPERYIMNPDSITSDDIKTTKNAEVRRCIKEILGGEYAKRLDLEELDRHTGHPDTSEILYRTKDPDETTGEHIHYLNVICPSTGREYYLCVPHTIKYALAAWDWGFGLTTGGYEIKSHT
jgi:hypothetical protein